MFEFVVLILAFLLSAFSDAETPDYELILSHVNIADGVFSSSLTVSGIENGQNASANTYSIIGQFDAGKQIAYREHRAVGGKFQFKLDFYYNNDIVDTMEWKQSSWITDSSIVGFELIGDITGSDGQVFPLDAVAEGNRFSGLGLNLGTFSQFSWLDGSGGDHGFFYQSVGCTQAFTKGHLNGIVAMAEREADGTGYAHGQRLYIMPVPTPSPTSEPTPQATLAIDNSTEYTGLIRNTEGYVFVADPFGSFHVSVELILYDKESKFTPIQNCAECMVWQYRVSGGGGDDDAWVDLDHFGDAHLQSTISGVVRNYEGLPFTTKYTVTLAVGSLRVGDTCAYLTDNTRVFEPGQTYEMRLTWTRTVDADVLQVTPASITTVETNVLPSGGECGVLDDGNLQVLQPYTVQCSGWSGNGDGNVQFNSMFNNVRLNEVFVDDAADIWSVGPPGNVTIMVLIRASDAIACFPIQAVFEFSQNAEEFLAAADWILDSDDAAMNVGLLSIVAAATAYAGNSGLISIDEAQRVYEDLTEIIVSNSKAAANASVDDVANDFAAVSSIASNPEFISDATVGTLAGAYLDDRYDAIDNLVADDAIGGDELGSMMSSAVNMLGNLSSTLGDAAAEGGGQGRRRRRRLSAADNNALANTIVDRVTECSSIALMLANPGESVTLSSGNTVVSGTKFLPDDEWLEVPPSCGVGSQSIVVPHLFLESQAGNAFDCSFMTSTRNNFISETGDAARRESNIVSTTMYGWNGGGRRRRRLFSPIVTQTDRCFPYLITMALTNTSLAFNQSFSLESAQSWPSCEFWNVEGTTWDTSGCFVTGITDESITCGCTHLTTFSLSKDDIVPEANFLTELDWRRFTVDNLDKYPAVWATCVVLLALFLFLCWVDPRSDIPNPSIVAFEDIIYKSVQEEKLWRDISGKEIRLLASEMPNPHLLGHGLKLVSPDKQSKQKLCMLQLKLYKVYLRNEHTLLSVFQRTAGTNYSATQRLGVFYMYLCTVMVVTGTFYGVEQGSAVSDVVASFLISFFGTAPGFVAKKCFMNSKPKIVPSRKHDLKQLAALHKKQPSSKHLAADSSIATASGDFSDLIGEMKGFVTQRGGAAKVQLKDFQTHVSTLYDDKDETQKVLALSNIRQLVYDQVFPLPYACRYVTWTLILMWAVAACVMAIVYGLQFDTLYAEQGLNADNPNYDLYQSDCWNTSLQLQMEAQATEQDFAQLNDQQAEENASSYAGGDSGSWLLSIMQSLLQSLLLWQPLTVYLVTWIKIWAFSWHLKMSIGPGNLIQLFKRCCCRKDDENDEDGVPDNEFLSPASSTNWEKLIGRASQQSNRDRARTTLKIKHVIAHADRPMDIISFLANDEWVINDVDADNNTQVQDAKDTNKEGGGNNVTLVVEQVAHAKEEKEPDAEQHQENGTALDSFEDVPPSEAVAHDSQNGDSKEEEELDANANGNEQASGNNGVQSQSVETPNDDSGNVEKNDQIDVQLEMMANKKDERNENENYEE